MSLACVVMNICSPHTVSVTKARHQPAKSNQLMFFRALFKDVAPISDISTDAWSPSVVADALN